MSFAGTPLGQGRRLDHSTFLGKNPPPARATSPHRIVPTSYSYNSASTLESRSPPRRRPSSPPHSNQVGNEDSDISALAKFARIKQREALTSRPGASKIPSSHLRPDSWAVKDTSVILASALHIAAEGDMIPAPNPNTAWASGVTRPNPVVPRSTSVEYEKETQITASRRLAPPPQRLSRPPVSRKPVSKNASVRLVPDSEGEEDTPANGRGKSPFEHVIDVAKKALGPATYYMRQLSHEPEDRSLSTNGNNSHNRDNSYDYAAEEQDFQEAQQAKLAPHKRGRISMDYRAYKPTASDAESDDDDYSDDDKRRRRRRKKKNEPVGGPLTTLPVLSADKRKKRKSKGTKNGLNDQDQEDSESDDPSVEIESVQTQQRTSVPRTLPIRPQTYDSNLQDSSLESAEQGLDSIPEVPEEILPDPSPTYDRIRERSQTRRPPRSSSRTRNSAPPTRFSIGGFLGRLVNAFFRGLFSLVRFVIHLITTVFFVCGRVVGSLYDVVLNQPVLLLRNAKWSSPAKLAKYLAFGALLLGAWYAYPQLDIQSLRSSLPSLPSFPSSTRPIYTVPNVPAADITELALRLQKIELAFSELSHESKQTRTKTGDDIRSELLSRLGALESRLSEETKRHGESESKVKSVLGLGTSVGTIQRDVEILQAQLMAQARQREEEERNRVGHTNDEEARAKLQALEERVGTVEGDVKEAVELGKKASTNAKSVTLKVPGGQDLNKLIQEAAISAISKDLIGKADYAMHSGGARVIPSLTSPSYEIQPETLGSQFFGFLTGNGYAVGRPPVTALHHETHGGYCWPFAGQRGQLGVSLAAPVIIDEVTIDHISRDIALDIRSAPRHMEVWGLVEGGENLDKYDELVKAKEQRQGGLEQEEYPDTLSQYPPYVRIANFTYDVDSGKHVQTFPVLEEIKEMEMDFGVVVLRVLSNWGREEFTCLYRFRVHGTRLGGMPIPEPVEDLGL